MLPATDVFMTPLSQPLFRRYRDWSVLELCKFLEAWGTPRSLARLYRRRVDLLQRHGQSRAARPLDLLCVPVDHLSRSPSEKWFLIFQSLVGTSN